MELAGVLIALYVINVFIFMFEPVWRYFRQLIVEDFGEEFLENCDFIAIILVLGFIVYQILH